MINIFIGLIGLNVLVLPAPRLVLKMNITAEIGHGWAALTQRECPALIVRSLSI